MALVQAGAAGIQQQKPALTLEPLRRESVRELVARRIEGLIRSGELRAGDRLPPEPELARILRVSRSSLREALKGLMFLGLLKARPGHGTFISSSLSRVASRHFEWMVVLEEVKHLEVYELRKIIEPAAAALAATRATPNDIERMRAALMAMRANLYRPDRFHNHDIEFHEAFAQAACNTAIQTTMRMLYDSMAEARRRVLPLIENMERHWKRHERVFNCIRERKPEAARRAVLKDLEYAESLLRKSLRVHERRAESPRRRAGKSRRRRRTGSEL